MGLLTKATVNLNTAVSDSEAAESSAAGIRTILNNYHASNPSFHCLVLETAADSDTVRAAAGMISQFGLVRVLPGGNCLALIPGEMDRELLAHRLSKSVKARTLFQFSAKSAAEAFEALIPCL